LFEAVVLAVTIYRKDPWLERIGREPCSMLKCARLERSTHSLQQVERWLDGATSSRTRQWKKARLRRSFRALALTVDLVGALADFDDVTVGIADVAANLAVLGDRCGDELGASTLP
jgi:hypothetical protein